MSLMVIGDGTTNADVDTNTNALRVSPRPLEPSTGGFYHLCTFSGALTGVAGAGPVWSLRWTSSTLYFVLLSFRWSWYTTTAFGTTQIVDHSLYIARAFTGADSAGTTATISGNNCKVRTSMPTTAVANIQYGATGAITAGTRTLDGQPLMNRRGISSGVNTMLTDNGGMDFRLRRDGPPVIFTNEGLVLNNVTAMGASGVIKLAVEVEWAEIPLAYY